MKKVFFAALAAIVLNACHTEPHFKVEGHVSDADGKMLYLEASTLEGIVPLDSAKLKGKGSFSFRQQQPESPEFYRLRVEDRVINFSIDSTETVRIEAPCADFSTAYRVEGSPNSEKIKELTLKQLKLQTDINDLNRFMQERRIGRNVFGDSVEVLVSRYKDEVRRQYIFAAPNTAAAYFALFQKVNNYLIFDPLNNRDDIKCFAAVATSLNKAFPHAVRSRNLYNIVIKGMSNTRTPRQKVLELPEELVSETGIIDISLRDLKGNVHKLSDLKGKVVLLDFTIYQSTVSSAHNYMLIELYNKYAGKGLEIYQVSLDADEHFWKTTADNLPWICVRDGNGIYSSFATSYNVQKLPAIYLIDRNNELNARGETLKDLEVAVRALL